MRAAAIAKKRWLALVRDRKALAFLFIFPITFMALFGVAFNQDFGGVSRYDVAVINLDTGMNGTGNVTAPVMGDVFVSILKEMNHTDDEGRNTSRVFNVLCDLTLQEAEEAVKSGDLDAVIVIPANFSSALYYEAYNYAILHLPPEVRGTIVAPPRAESELLVKGDPGRQSFYAVNAIIQAAYNGFREQVKRQTLRSFEATDGNGTISFQEPATGVRAESVATDKGLTYYDYIVPGMILFGILMTAVGVTNVLAEEKDRGYLDRLKITRMTSADLIIGTLIPYSFVAVLQMGAMFGTAVLMGYHYNSSANLWLASLVAFVAGMATVALGLIMASFVKNSHQAGSIGPLVTVPISFLIGAFFPFPNPTLIADFYGRGQDFGVLDILPWKQAALAFSRIMTFGSGLESTVINIILLVVETVVLLAMGIFLYDRMQLKRE